MGLGLAVLALGVGLALSVVGATWWLTRRAWQQRKAAKPVVLVMAALVVASVAAGALGTVLGVVKGAGAIGGASIDTSQKARILAEGISEAMNCGALTILVWVPSAIATYMLTRSKRPAGS
jgi:hypothetical protein